ncbi:MAG: hypothetical protein LBN05_01780 [Oscillospiraceae bacterium]|nr:hypothetical protein [Oscillospiraceae bacterium]
MEASIEKRQASRGRPAAMLHSGVSLSKKQSFLLENLPEEGCQVVLPRKKVSLRDLAALTLATDVEYTMFTKGNQRKVVRGNHGAVSFTEAEIRTLVSGGWRWSGHTHPGVDFRVLLPSKADKDFLRAFPQAQSAIINSSGRYYIFGKE